MKLNRNRRQKGFSLIEVMVALIITSVGLLGLAMLQVQGMKFNTNAYLRTQATLLANDIIDRIRTNPGGDYTVDVSSATAPDCSAGCSVNNVAILDLITWSASLSNTLSSPEYTITQSGTEYVIDIKWKDRGVLIKQAWTIQA